MAAKKLVMWFNIGLRPDGEFYYSLKSEDGEVKAFINASHSVLTELEGIKRPVVKQVKEGRKTIDKIVSEVRGKVTINPETIVTKKGKKILVLDTEAKILKFLDSFVPTKSSMVGATPAIRAAAAKAAKKAR